MVVGALRRRLGVVCMEFFMGYVVVAGGFHDTRIELAVSSSVLQYHILLFADSFSPFHRHSAKSTPSPFLKLSGCPKMTRKTRREEINRRFAF